MICRTRAAATARRFVAIDIEGVIAGLLSVNFAHILVFICTFNLMSVNFVNLQKPSVFFLLLHPVTNDCFDYVCTMKPKPIVFRYLAVGRLVAEGN